MQIERVCYKWLLPVKSRHRRMSVLSVAPLTARRRRMSDTAADSGGGGGDDDDDDDTDNDGGGGGNVAAADDVVVVVVDDGDDVTAGTSSIAFAILNIAPITSEGADINMYTWYHSP